MKETTDIYDTLPDEIREWIADSNICDSSGHSGATTIYIDRNGGAYLKIAEKGKLYRASQMQKYFADKNLSSPLLYYLSDTKDYMIVEAITGEDGTSQRYLSEPEHLSELFGKTLRTLHELDASDCPVKNKMAEFLQVSENTVFSQDDLDDISDYIGTAKSELAFNEISSSKGILKNDVLIHGDYCLPNIIIEDWRFKGLIDIADGGIGDRHYDLVLGLWTLNWNLKSPKYGQYFLDAYGRDCIDNDRLRICGLLAAGN